MERAQCDSTWVRAMNFARFKDSEAPSPWGCEGDSGSLFEWNGFFWGVLPRLPTSIKYKKEKVVSHNTFH